MVMKYFFVLVTWCILASISISHVGCQPEQVPEKDGMAIPETESEFRDKMAEYKIQRQKVLSRIKRVERRKAEQMNYLEAKGIQSPSDIDPTDADTKFALKNLKAWNDELKRYQKEVLNYDEVISGIQAMLQKIERNQIREDVIISDEDYVNLKTLVRLLNEDLEIDRSDPVEDQELIDLFTSEKKQRDDDNLSD